MRKIASLLSVLMLVCALAFGQARTITGTVRDANGAAVPFATITEAGTKNASQADANGNFTIQVPENAQLTISASGYTAQTVAVSGAGNVVLARNEGQLSEVVVTALGVRRERRGLGFSVSEVKGDQLTKANNQNLVNSLSGKVAGVQVTGSGGAPGPGFKNCNSWWC